MNEPKFRFSHNGVATIPCDLAKNALFFRVRLNGSEPLWFTLDSGAGATYIDQHLAEKMGLQFTGTRLVQGAGKGKIKVRTFGDVSFELPEVVSDRHQIHSADLSSLHEQWGRRLDGFFGYDFLERFIVVLDYESKRLTVADPSTFHYDGPGEVFPLEFQGNLPFIRGTVEVAGNPPEDSLLLVDSGSQDGVDHPLIASSFGAKPTTTGVGLGRETRGVFGRVERLQLGRFELRGLFGAAGGAGLGARLIGGGVLSRFRVTFDYSHKRMILERTKQ